MQVPKGNAVDDSPPCVGLTRGHSQEVTYRMCDSTVFAATPSIHKPYREFLCHHAYFFTDDSSSTLHTWRE